MSINFNTEEMSGVELYRLHSQLQAGTFKDKVLLVMCSRQTIEHRPGADLLKEYANACKVNPAKSKLLLKEEE